MEVCNLAVREHSVDGTVNLKLGAELGEEGKALLLAGKLKEVGTLAHDGGTAGGHLEDLLLLGFPGDDVEFLNLGLTQEPACMW